MEDYKDEPLVNTITVMGDKGDKEFSLVPEGIHRMGLVKVKNVDKMNTHKGIKEPAYRFVFRSYDDPEAYVTCTVTSKTGDRSHLRKLIKVMSEHKFKFTDTTDDKVSAFRFIQESVDKWYKVAVEHWQTREGETRASVAGYDVRPIPVVEGETTPQQYFDGATSKPKPVVEDVFGAYEDEPPEFKGEEPKKTEPFDFDGDDTYW